MGEPWGVAPSRPFCAFAGDLRARCPGCLQRLLLGGGGARTGRAAPWLWTSGQARPAGSRARQRTATGCSPAPHHATDATPASLAPPPGRSATGGPALSASRTPRRRRPRTLPPDRQFPGRAGHAVAAQLRGGGSRSGDGPVSSLTDRQVNLATGTTVSYMLLYRAALVGLTPISRPCRDTDLAHLYG